MRGKMKCLLALVALLVLGGVMPGWAEEAVAAVEPSAAEVVANETSYAIDNMFLLFCAVLVLFMQVGFALVESGFNSAKNTVNILFKNLMDLSVGMILFFIKSNAGASLKKLVTPINNSLNRIFTSLELS